MNRFCFVAAHMTAIFERFCHNDVEGLCVPFFNCTPCHITLADPSCIRIQYVDPGSCQQRDAQELLPHFSWKTEVEIENCMELRNQCQERFEDCLAPFSDCIRNCAMDLDNLTLYKYSSREGIMKYKTIILNGCNS